MPKRSNQKNKLGSILIALGLLLALAGYVGIEPIASIVNPILKPIVDAITGVQPSQPASQDNNQPNAPNTPTPSSTSSEGSDRQSQQPSPQKTSQSDSSTSINSNLPQKVGSAVIFGGEVQRVELSK